LQFLIDDVKLWDGTGTPAQSKMSVEVRNGRIHWIGPAAEWHANRATIRVVDGRARTLIPGLWIVMFTTVARAGPIGLHDLLILYPKSRMRAVELAETSLRSGVTTARDVGAPQGVSVRLAHAARAGEIRAPNIRAAGTWIAHRGTYVPFAIHFGEADELRTAIRMEMESGVDLIKVALSGWNEGARPEGAPEIPFGEKLLSVAVEEAHRAGFKIACHANDATSCKIAAHRALIP